jgi:hypothetical protein
MTTKVCIRRARSDELRFLQTKTEQQLPDGFEPVDLRKSVVFVADDDGVIAGLAAAGLTWHVEPLILFPEFARYAPQAMQRRAVYGLGRAITEHIADYGGEIRRYFAHVDDPKFRTLAQRFGLRPAYPGGEILKGGSE